MVTPHDRFLFRNLAFYISFGTISEMLNNSLGCKATHIMVVLMKEEFKPKCLYCFVDKEVLKECRMNLRLCKVNLKTDKKLNNRRSDKKYGKEI